MLIRLCFGILAALSGLAAQSNTLLIIADDLGVEALRLYGVGRAAFPPTPNLDSLAQNGVVFRNAYATPACTPTRATILTGRYGFRTGVLSVSVALPFSELTLPEVLNTKSIPNALIGKWHLGGRSPSPSHPNTTGFQHFAGSLPAYFYRGETYYDWVRVVDGQSARTTNYATTQNVDDASAWISKQSSPWVCSVNFNAAHSPFHAPPAALHTQNLTGKSPSREPRAFFLAMVEAMDREIGRLLSSLGAARAKTNIIFVGDNGTDPNVVAPPFSRGKGKFTVYEGGTHVPLLVSGPAVASPGRSVDALVHSVDLFASVLELHGIDARGAVPSSVPLDSVSIVPYLANPNQAALRDFAYYELSQGTPQVAIRNHRYKLLRRGTNEEFYDLQVDPYEGTNLYGRGLSDAEKYERDLLAAEIDRLRGRSSWFAFGKGCPGAAGVPSLTTQQKPALGSAFTTTVSRLGSSPAALGALGLSNSQFGPFRLPLDLAGAGAAGCSLYVSIDASDSLANASGVATWRIRVPNDAGLLGLHFYQQAFVLDASANSLGLVASNAGRGTIERN